MTVVVELCTRWVTKAGIVAEPTGAWVEQVARGLVDGFWGALAGKRFLLHDRSAVFTERFRAILAACGVETVKLPARSPNLNAHLERWIRSIRQECLDHLILFGERSLRRAVEEDGAHFHRERSHEGLENRIIAPELEPWNRAGEVRCRKGLGGLLKYYREAT